MEEHTAYIGVGSNKGDRRAHLRRSVEGLDGRGGVQVVRTSPVYETEAHTRGPDDSSSSYLNAVVEVCTRLSPERLLDVLQELERAAGRRRTAGDRWRARTLDLDLLVYDAVTCQTGRLTLPHPRLGDRRFVLEPLAEIDASAWVPAPFERTAAELLEQCHDSYTLEKTDLQLEPTP